MPNRLNNTVKSIFQLGLGPSALYGLYQLGLRSGHYRRLTPPGRIPPPADIPPKAQFLRDILLLPEAAALREVMGSHSDEALELADEIVSGKFRMFGGAPVPLDFSPVEDPLRHWTAYEQGKQYWLNGKDIKFIWEPARFGWVFTLARAYRISGNDRYTKNFWELAEKFMAANPPNLGPQWASGQEVAHRLMALSFGGQVFKNSPESIPERINWLCEVISAHARRIPVTLVYARAQNNNHLLSESAGLLTASLVLPETAETKAWGEAGRKWFFRAIQAQIDTDGAYIQHSMNYHRCMLHLALWVSALLHSRGEQLPEEATCNLAKATRWLAERVDPESGKAPNLGHNDGSNLLPLSPTGYSDFRATLQAAGRAFLGVSPLPAGSWDELALWTGNPRAAAEFSQPSCSQDIPPSTILRGKTSWAELRAVHFSSRPAHADQLHVELWWHGINLAQDAGTYLYNAPPPWDNSLASTRVHNTITVDGCDQMIRAGRFRWLDWAQAEGPVRELAGDGACWRISASHSGYRRIGIIHRRQVELSGLSKWIIRDELVPTGRTPSRLHSIDLQWLMPDFPWEWTGDMLVLSTPWGKAELRITAERTANDPPLTISPKLVRCGGVLFGDPEASDAISGWVSPTYGDCQPALSFHIRCKSTLPVTIQSSWELHEKNG